MYRSHMLDAGAELSKCQAEVMDKSNNVDGQFAFWYAAVRPLVVEFVVKECGFNELYAFPEHGVVSLMLVRNCCAWARFWKPEAGRRKISEKSRGQRGSRRRS